MSRVLVSIAVVCATILWTSSEVGACGDKFTRLGRGTQFPRYGALYPASILIYRPANATPKGIRELEMMLKHAGHKPVVAERGTFAARVSTASFELVIASYDDAVALRNELRSIPAAPEVVPILNKPTKALTAEAQKQFRHLLVPREMSKVEALNELDRVLQERREGPPSGATGGRR